MHEFSGDLLIGGARLKALHGELEDELHSAGSQDWQLGGHLRLSPHEWETMQLNRQYRLELNDGRAGQVIITDVVSRNVDEVIVEFHYVPRQVRKAK